MGMKLSISIVMLLTIIFAAQVFAAKVEENVDYRGWKCIKLSNQTTEVYLAPQLAGRIIQYTVEGHPFLWVNKALAGKIVPPEKEMNMEKWVNYGGDKLWPAPQGWDRPDQWPGPGDAVLDGQWTAEVLVKEGPEVKVRLTSPDKEKGGYAGIQFIRELTLADGSSRLYLDTTMKNISDRIVSWGIWSVTQMDWSDKDDPKNINRQARLVVPLNPESIWPEKYQVMFGLATSFNWKPDYEKNLMIVTYENLVGKVGLDVSAGWAAMVDEKSGYTYVQRFPYFPGKPYPDNASFEIWVNGAGQFIHDHKLRVAPDDPAARLIEMEVLSPKVTLKPGEAHSISTSWEAHKGGLESVPDLEKGYIPK